MTPALLAEVMRMIDEVPLYADRPRPPANVDDAPALEAWFSSLPTVTKRELRRGFPKNLVRRGQDLRAAMNDGLVELISTSGTTDNRLQILWENAWWPPQERECMRLNRSIANAIPEYPSPFQEAVLTTPVCGTTCHVGDLKMEERVIEHMLFLNQVDDPSHFTEAELDRMLDEWNRWAAVGVEADPAYLAALCRHATKKHVAMHNPKYIQLTYELTTRAHLRAIKRALTAPLFQLYGASEAGALFMECEGGLLVHNARHSHVELKSHAPPTIAKVIVTTLGRPWMPLLRYEVGDIVRVPMGRPGDAPKKCGCGVVHDGLVIERVEGRLGDCIDAPNRTFVTPAMLDDVIDAADETVEGWQLSIDAQDAYTLHLVAAKLPERVAAAVAELVGKSVSPRVDAAIVPEPSGKYRLVKRAS